MLRRLAALIAALMLLVVTVPAGAARSGPGPDGGVAAGAPPAPAPAAVKPVATGQDGATRDLPLSATDESAVPHYFGPYSNYANSPQVMVNAVVEIAAPPPVAIGNPLVARATATDTEAAFGVVAGSALPAGMLRRFQVWNQEPTPGLSGDIFHAYVLRPTANPDEYTVVYDSGPLTAPNLADPLVPELVSFPVTPNVAVENGDVIGWYGKGIPFDLAAGTDVTASPVGPDAPIAGAVVSLGVDPLFPVAARDRIYSLSATVRTDPGEGATATATVDSKTGAISDITVTSPGQGYLNAPAVTITAPGMTPTTQATATAVISEGVVNSITVDEAGFGFTAPAVTFAGGNFTTGFEATAAASGGVDNIVITNGGSGYQSQPIVTITLPDITVGGVRATATATMDANGTVTGIEVADPGSGYTKAPGVTITDASEQVPTEFATATATIGISAVSITSGGKGYDSAPTVTIADTVGVADKGASATATVAVKGAVTGITVTNPGAGYLTPGIRKFVNTLPGLGPDAANDQGNYIPVGVPDTTTYPGADYYEIGLVQYRHTFHEDVPPTLLRGYVQLSTDVVPGARAALSNESLDPNGPSTPILLPDGSRARGVDVPHYLGPTIVATKDRPVRILFRNLLPTGVGGDLFLPVDTTLMGAGMGPDSVDLDGAGVPIDTTAEFGSVLDEARNPMCSIEKMDCYSENRATLHLHGGVTPWISDGTPHQWITPADEATRYPEGVSVSNVPDMPDPEPGSMTFFYTNQQSARLMFYHDHAWGITRLNVYAGEAAGYVITDDVEKALTAPGGAMGDDLSTPTVDEGLGIGTPLIIQDKTFVPANIHDTDPTWDTSKWGGEGSLWAPHVYMPAQNPNDPSGMSSFGRWMYGPWFWPPSATAKYQPIDNPYYDPACDLDNPDTWQYQSEPFCEPPQIPGTPNVSVGMEAFNDTPIVNGTAYPKTTVEPKAYRYRILNAANDRFWNLSWYVADPTTGTLSEVALKPAEVEAALTDTAAFPTPDETKSPKGPDWVQIGTEGGFLPSPVTIPAQPTTWITDPTRFDVGNVDQHSLLLAPAERADVIVDFSKYRGKTLILYNDAPAAFPARVACYDYYTGSADLRPACANTTLPGYGPNTRTIMQVKVSNAAPALAWDRPNTTNDRQGRLVAAFKHQADGSGVFESGQNPIIVGQSSYNDAYGSNFAAGGWCSAPTNPSARCDGYARIQEGAKPGDKFKFDTLDGAQLSIPYEPKGIHDEMNSASFDEYGRMTANLGLEAPGATPITQNIILYPYVNPVTEILDANGTPSTLDVTPISSADDGTQIWKITHNGVDTHPIHFHLYDVQVLNRVAWDNNLQPPDPNELGWKDTVRINPLQDTYVAIRPIVPELPFNVPDSRRPLNPMMPIGAQGSQNGVLGTEAGFNNTNAAGAPIAPIVNAIVDFNWEYVFHCHILSHEEMDMMRPVSVKVDSEVPDAPVLTRLPGGPVVLGWTDGTLVDYANLATWTDPKDEVGYKILRATLTAGEPGPYTQIGTALANAVSYTDETATLGTVYRYKVVAWNEAGEGVSNTLDASVALVVTASSPTILYGDPVPTITAAYTPDLPAPVGEATCSTTYTVGDPVGTYATSCTGATPDPIFLGQVFYVDGTLTVGPAPLTITAPSFTVSYGDPKPDPILPAYDGLVAGDLAPATVGTCDTTYAAGSPVSGSPYPVTCTGFADTNYAITLVDGTVTVGKAPATVTAPSLTILYGADAPALTPTYSTGVDPDTTLAVCTTTYVTGDPVGAYPITCDGALDSNYAYTYVDGVLTVDPAPLTITAPSFAVTYGDAVPGPMDPAYAGLVAGDLAPATVGTCTTTYTQGSGVGGSPYPVTCTGFADTNYGITLVDGTVTVAQAALTITASTGTMVYGAAVPAITPIYAGLVAPDTAPATPPACSTTATSTSDTGVYPSTCSGAADPNYTISYAAGTVTITPAPLTITAPSFAVTYGDAVPGPMDPAYAGLVAGDLAPATVGTCTTTYTQGSGVGGSPYPVTCTGFADTNYGITLVDGTVTVAQAALTITASTGTMVYGAAVPAITPIYAGLVAPDTAPATPPACSTTATSTSDTGVYPSTCSGAADPNYTISYAAGTVTVTPAPQAIVFAAQANRTWGTVSFLVSATSTSGLAVAFTSDTPATCMVTGTAVFLVAPGLCTITATQPGNGNWQAAAPVSRSLTILRAPVTIGLSTQFNPTKAGAITSFVATVNNPNPLAGTPTGTLQLVVDGVDTGAAVPVIGSAVVIQTSALTTGNRSITVRYSGDTYFLGATSAALAHTVVAQLTTTTVVVSNDANSVFRQSVTFTATVTPQNGSLGINPGGTVQFTLDGANLGAPQAIDAFGVASITTTGLSVGTHAVRAVYPGDTNYTSSTSAPLAQVVSRASTGTTLTLTTPVSRQNTITYRATVVAVAPGGGTPTGTVRFFRNGNRIGTATLVNGVAVLSYRNTGLNTGTYQMTARYVASTNYAGSTSPVVNQRVTR